MTAAPVNQASSLPSSMGVAPRSLLAPPTRDCQASAFAQAPPHGFSAAVTHLGESNSPLGDGLRRNTGYSAFPVDRKPRRVGGLARDSNAGPRQESHAGFNQDAHVYDEPPPAFRAAQWTPRVEVRICQSRASQYSSPVLAPPLILYVCLVVPNDDTIGQGINNSYTCR